MKRRTVLQGVAAAPWLTSWLSGCTPADRPSYTGGWLGDAPARGGYEIVDKMARKGIFIEGALAEQFQLGVQALAEQSSTQEAFDEYIARFGALAQQPLVVH